MGGVRSSAPISRPQVHAATRSGPRPEGSGLTGRRSRKPWSRGLGSCLLALLALLAAAPGRLLAFYVESQPAAIVQPDGSRLQLYVTGDEHYRWVHDTEGRVILPDERSGRATYAQKVDGALVPGPALVGVDDPVALGVPVGLRPDPGRFPASLYRDEGQEAGGPSTLAAGKPAFTRINNLVVFVRFAGEAEFPESRPVQAYSDSLFNGLAPRSTLKSYFLETSYAKLTIDSTFYPAPSAKGAVVSYQDPRPRGYYQPYGAGNPDGYRDDAAASSRERALVTAAASAIASQVPEGLDVDTNGDGLVDGIVFLVSGEADAWSGLLWPHKATLAEPGTTIRGKRVSAYNLELDASLTTAILCHEFFHTLGAPDLYHYPSCRLAPPDLGPVGGWDVMSVSPNPPQHMGAHLKWRYGGFLESIPSITASGTYTLSPQTSPTGNAYRIASPYSPDESFVVEYRRKTGTFESSLPGEGLVVSRIDGRLRGNACGPPDEVYVYRPGGTPSLPGALANAALSAGSGRTGIGETTDPVPFLRDGSSGGLSISQVGPAGDTITFHVDVPAGPCTGLVELTAPADGSAVTGTTASLSWAPVAGAQSYDVHLGTTTDPPLVSSGVAATSTTRAIAPGGLYYWRVVAHGSGGCSRSSALQTFLGVTTTPIARDQAVPVSDATAGGWRYYTLAVPSGATDLSIATSGGRGDVQLVVRYGQLPVSANGADCTSWRAGTAESCAWSLPWAGTYSIALVTGQAYSGVTLLATWKGAGASATPLARGVPVTVSDTAQGGWRYFSVEVPAGAANLVVRTSAGTGDAHLGVRYLGLPTFDAHDDCAARRPGNDEACLVSAPWKGSYYVGVYASRPYSGVSLVADWSTGTASSVLFVPVVLKAPGNSSAFFTSEMTLTNRGTGLAKVRFDYTAAEGGGSGSGSDTLEPGRQKVVPDAIDHLRSLGIPIPADGSRVGTLRVTFSGLGSASDAAVSVRTTTPVPPAAPTGAAGLSYAGVPVDQLPAGPVVLYGLRSDPLDRSNVAVQNAGGPDEGDVTLRTTLHSGAPGAAGSQVSSEETTLPPGGFSQLSTPDGFQGWARVERTAGAAPFHAYAVVNDNANSDGSFVAPAAASALGGPPALTLPVVVEASGYSTELIAANLSDEDRQLVMTLSADVLGSSSVQATFPLKAGEQASWPGFVDLVRRQVPDLPTGVVGPLTVSVERGSTSDLFVGARTGSAGGGGRYALFYGAVAAGAASGTEAWLYGLQQTATTRSNLALVNTGEVDASPSSFLVEVYSGATGRKVGETVVSVAARRQLQINAVLLELAPGTEDGYARVTKTSGANPFIAYGVLNDGASPGQRSGDGAYLASQ